MKPTLRRGIVNATRGIALLAITTGGVLVAPPVASADTAVTVQWTGIGIYPRETPSMDAPHAGAALSDGTTVSVVCETQGQAVPNGDQESNIWDQLADGTWLPNAYLDTGTDSWTPGVPRCASESGDQDQAANMHYNRSAAARWALGHAQDFPDPFYASGCTWFVSNALWAGGFQEDDVWTSKGTHGNARQVPGSVAAWSAPEFLDYLESHYDIYTMNMDFAANAVPEAEVGDIVAYDWEGDGSVDHLAFITEIGANDYPVVSEWGVGYTVLREVPGAASYTKRGWSYSINDDTWLQVNNPDVTATLYHVQGGVFLPNF